MPARLTPPRSPRQIIAAALPLNSVDSQAKSKLHQKTGGTLGLGASFLAHLGRRREVCRLFSAWVPRHD